MSKGTLRYHGGPEQAYLGKLRNSAPLVKDGRPGGLLPFGSNRLRRFAAFALQSLTRGGR